MFKVNLGVGGRKDKESRPVGIWTEIRKVSWACRDIIVVWEAPSTKALCFYFGSFSESLWGISWKP